MKSSNHASFSLVKVNSRFWELDLIKGNAIILVMLFHLMCDINFFKICEINENSWIAWSIANTAAISFIVISGVASSISFEKNKQKNDQLRKLLLRSSKLMLLALFISVLTFQIMPENFIVFGILHFLAIAPILTYFVMQSKLLIALLSLAILFATPIITNIKSNSYNLVWLGVEPLGFSSLDYFPIFPWLSLYLFGIFIGRTLYSDGTRIFYLHDLSNNKIVRFFNYLGKNTLIIYLAHQPIFLGIIYLLT